MYEKVKLKGHESFCIREGWVTKGLLAVQENPRVFSEKDEISPASLTAVAFAASFPDGRSIP